MRAVSRGKLDLVGIAVYVLEEDAAHAAGEIGEALDGDSADNGVLAVEVSCAAAVPGPPGTASTRPPRP